MENKILVTRSSMPEIDEYMNEITSMWDSHWLTNMGPKHKELQDDLCEYLGVENIDLLTNGHMALELTLQALNLQGEVITTPFTFASTTHAIVRNGLTPVFCDIDPETYCMDARKIEKLITDRTCAIMPVHVYGNVCNIEEIERIAHKYELKVIYDAAHTFGETYKGKGIGSFGDASCISFHATKVFNSIEGGAVCFKDKQLGQKLYELKNFGIHGPEEIPAVGANAKMNEFCAAMGLCNLRHVDDEIIKRKAVVERYRERLSGVGPFQNGILSEVLLETKHRIQQLFLFFQHSGVREQVNLEEAFAFDHTVDGYCDPSHGQCFISYSLEQLSCGRDQDTSEVGRIIQFRTAMSTLRNGAAVVINVYRSSVLSAVAVFPVIAYIQRQAIRNQSFIC